MTRTSDELRGVRWPESLVLVEGDLAGKRQHGCNAHTTKLERCSSLSLLAAAPSSYILGGGRGIWQHRLFYKRLPESSSS